MQKTNSVDRYVDLRLKSWARWEKRCQEQGLGYPSKSIEGRLREDGGVLSKSTAIPQLPFNPDAEEVAELLNELLKSKPKWVRAVKICYLEKASTSNLKKYNFKLPSYHDNLKLAKTFIAGRLSK